MENRLEVLFTRCWRLVQAGTNFFFVLLTLDCSIQFKNAWNVS
jgi:hypothetical protein